MSEGPPPADGVEQVADAATDAAGVAHDHAAAEGAAEGATEKATEAAAEASADAAEELSTADRMKNAALSTEPHDDLGEVEFPWNPEDGGETRVMRGLVKGLHGADMPNPLKTAVGDVSIGLLEVVYVVRTGGKGGGSDGEDGEDDPDESAETTTFETPTPEN